MKILALEEAPAKNTLIRLILGSITRFVEKDGVSELHVGFGPTKPLSQRKMTIFLRKVVVLAKQNKLRTIALEWSEIRKLADKKISDKKLGEILAIAFQMANFEFTVYKQEPKEGFDSVDEVAILNAPKLARESFVRGEIIALEVNSTRALSNTPGGDMTPKILSSVAKTIAQRTKVEVQVLGKKEMEKLGMGAVLGIAKGSTEEPQFIVMEYRGAAKSKKPVVLIGKGVTFDTGGLQVKPGDSMYEMHMD
ncbi:MAG: leucyl aminopeptidase, partial [Parcubacteria group bacterium Gr01-1014_56]